MRIAICDDNDLDRELIVDMLTQCFEGRHVRCELVPYSSGINLAYDVEDGEWYDAVFLDIYMNAHLGIDVAHRLRAGGYEGEIVFLTVSSEYAVDSYDVDAAWYLLKPLSFDKLERALDKITKTIDERTYPVRQRGSVAQVPVKEILYIESSNNKCVLHRAGGINYTVYKRLDGIERELHDRRFLRCHQSYLVNMDHVERAERSFLMDDGSVVLIRQRGLKTARQAYLDYVSMKEDEGTSRT